MAPFFFLMIFLIRRKPFFLLDDVTTFYCNRLGLGKCCVGGWMDGWMAFFLVGDIGTPMDEKSLILLLGIMVMHLMKQ